MTRTLIASAFLMFASAASANSPIVFTAGEPPQARVTYDDVDVHSTGGRSIVEKRIRSASEQLCIDGQVDPALLQPMKRFTDCYNIAVASGISQLDRIASQ
jgi:UrcA family protein